MNDRALFTEGLRREKNLVLVNTPSLLNSDKSIISNCVNFPPSVLNSALEQEAVFFFHDYIFCKWRLFFPGQDKCKICKHALEHLALFQKAKGLIFLSPLHERVYLEQFPQLTEIPRALVPSALNTNLFNSPPEPLKDTVLTINTLLPFKGRENILRFIREHNEFTFTVVGHDPDDTTLPKNARFCGLLKYKELIKLFATHEYYVELPETPQPFNRTCAEAKLAGCKVITNSLMGAASYPEFRDKGRFKDLIDNAPETFWKFIEEVL